MTSRAYHLYICFDVNDEPIYVGITGDVDRRMRNHRNQSSWFHEVDHTESLWCASKEDASELESCYAAAVRPRHNTRLVPGRSVAGQHAAKQDALWELAHGGAA